jgi:hypothetical protein
MPTPYDPEKAKKELAQKHAAMSRETADQGCINTHSSVGAGQALSSAGVAA